MSRRAAALRAAAEAADPRLPDREHAAARISTFEERIQKATWKAMREWLKLATSAVLGRSLTAAPGDEQIPNPNEIAAFAEQWAVLVDQHIVGAIDKVLGERFGELLEAEQVISARPWQEQYLAGVRNRMADVPTATFDLVRADVQLGIDNGDGIPEIRDRIAGTLSAREGGSENEWLKRSRTIARTEVTGAYNGGHIAAIQTRNELTGQQTQKVWLATIDSRTRDDHFEADGQRVNLEDPFDVGGEELQFPGDPDGSAEQTVNCRCTMLEVEPDEELPDTSERQLADPGDVEDEIASRAENGVVRAYDEQDDPDAVLAAASPKETTMPRRTWRSAPVLAPFSKPTGDGRIFRTGGLTSRDLPLPLLYQENTSFGHDGSTTVGRILEVSFTDAGIVATGDYLDDPALEESVSKAIALVEAGLGGVSVDLDSVVGSLVDENGNEVDMDWLIGEWEQGNNPIVYEQVDEGRLIGVTQVATPAFAEAAIELDPIEAEVGDDVEAALQDSAGEDVEVGAIVTVTVPGDQIGGGRPEDELEVRGDVTAVDETAETVTINVQSASDGDPVEDGTSIVAPVASVTVVEPAPAADEEDAAAQVASLTASAGSIFRPPAWAYEDPKLDGPTAITVTDEGRVYGHVAVWGTCHVGYPGQCVEPPKSPSEYGYFHTGAVRLDDGTRIAVGNLTLGGGHADPKLAWRQAASHYDRTGYGIATVRAYEDEHGIAVAGWLNPGATPEQIAELERSPLSGDWREIGGELDMIGALAVNSGGFPVPRYATGADGDRLSLVAAPGVRPDPEKRRRSKTSLATLRAQLRREVLQDVRADLSRRARLDRIVASVGLDARSRLDDVLADLD